MVCQVLVKMLYEHLHFCIGLTKKCMPCKLKGRPCKMTQILLTIEEERKECLFIAIVIDFVCIMHNKAFVQTFYYVVQ